MPTRGRVARATTVSGLSRLGVLRSLTGTLHRRTEKVSLRLLGGGRSRDLVGAASTLTFGSGLGRSPRGSDSSCLVSAGSLGNVTLLLQVIGVKAGGHRPPGPGSMSVLTDLTLEVGPAVGSEWTELLTLGNVDARSATGRPSRRTGPDWAIATWGQHHFSGESSDATYLSYGR